MAATRTPRPSGCPAAHQTARAVPGSCRQPPVAGPTSGRSRGRSITLAGTAVPAVGVQHARARMYALRVGARLRSEATVTGQVGPDRRRTTHPRSPARAHHRAGLGGTGGLRAHPAGCRSRGTPPVRSTDPIKPPRAWLRRTRQGPGQRPSRIFRQPRSPPRTRRLSRRGRPSSRGIELPCPACRLRSIRRWALRGPEDQRRTPAVSWLPAGWLSSSARK